MRPRRTIRFVLFTGEEQGLHAQKPMSRPHKDELPRISACLSTTPHGKITGIDAKHRPVLQPLLERELASLGDLGVINFKTAFIGGSDHASFDRVGVPGLMVDKNRPAMRSATTRRPTRWTRIEANLVQGAQVMAVTALRVANLDAMLPRDKPDTRTIPKSQRKTSRGTKACSFCRLERECDALPFEAGGKWCVCKLAGAMQSIS